MPPTTVCLKPDTTDITGRRWADAIPVVSGFSRTVLLTTTTIAR
jgi:hypothetical protein